MVSGGTLYSSDDTITVTVTDGEGSDGSGFSGTAVLATSGGSVVNATVNAAGTGYPVSQSGVLVTLTGAGLGIVLSCTTDGTGAITTVDSVSTNISTLTADQTAVAENSGLGNNDATFDIVAGFQIASVTVSNGGSGYQKPTVTFSAPAPTFGTGTTATGTAITGGDSAWNSTSIDAQFKVLKDTSAWVTGTSLSGGNNGTTLTAG